MKKKLGIIGAGWIVEKTLDSLNNSDMFELYGIYSRTYEKAHNLSKKYQIKYTFNTIDELLESDIDVVYIASHTNTHFEFSKLALLNHKDVICEKPFVLNNDEFEYINDLANKNNCIIMDAMRLLYLPTIHKIKQLIDDNLIGEVYYSTSSLGRISSRLYRHVPELAGGSMYDLLVYPLNAFVYLFGKPNKITADCLRLENNVDHTSNAILRYDNHIAIACASFTSQTQTNLRIQGSLGTLEIRDNFTENNTIYHTNINNEISLIKIDDFISDGIIYEFMAYYHNNILNDVTKSAYECLFDIKKQLNINYDCEYKK